MHYHPHSAPAAAGAAIHGYSIYNYFADKDKTESQLLFSS